MLTYFTPHFHWVHTVHLSDWNHTYYVTILMNQSFWCPMDGRSEYFSIRLCRKLHRPWQFSGPALGPLCFHLQTLMLRLQDRYYSNTWCWFFQFEIHCSYPGQKHLINAGVHNIRNMVISKNNRQNLYILTRIIANCYY